MSKLVNLNLETLRGWRGDVLVAVPAAPGLSPSSHRMVLPVIPVSGVRCLLLTPVGTRHADGAHTYTPAQH